MSPRAVTTQLQVA